MNGSARDDIRRLLKEFGLKADEALVAHLTRHPDVDSIDIRLTLEDLTDYGASPPDIPLQLKVEGTIKSRG
jgi:hypothetical protein